MCLLLALALCFAVLSDVVRGSCVKQLIIDTDLENFDDDPLAIGLANIFQIWGQAQILAIVSSRRGVLIPPAIDAIDTFYGHGDIPVAIAKPLTNETQDPQYPEFGDYITGLTYDFPETIRSGWNTTDPLSLYRARLAAAAASSVTIVVIGELDNLYALLRSGPDVHSPLSGRALIASKVSALAIQAAATGKSYNLDDHNATFAEVVLDTWPATVPMTFIGSNIGSHVRFGARLTTSLDLAVNPVAYAFNASVGYNMSASTWDATAMYYAVRGLDDVYAYNFTSGKVEADANATTTWVDPGLKSRDNALVFREDGIGNVSFAQRLEDILLWQPGEVVPESLKRIAACVNSTQTVGGNGSAAASASAVPTAVYVGVAVKGQAWLEGTVIVAGVVGFLAML